MRTDAVSRRSFVKTLGAASAAAYSAVNAPALNIGVQQATTAAAPLARTKEAATRAQRMAWWHEAKFGMFIHWGLYSLVGQHEWALEVEGIPILQYEYLAKHFQPKANAAREWARLARRAGQKTMVMRPPQHDGCCKSERDS